MSGTEKRGVRRSPQESLAKLKKLAQESGFELLETEWLGRDRRHRFRHIGSGVEHEWMASQLFSRGFPKNLRTEQDKLEQLKQLAESNGFELLEAEWLGGNKKHRFRHIESGKEYEGQPNNLFNQGFPKDLRTEQDKLEQLRQLAQESGFELLETEWLGRFRKHRFRHIESGKEYEGQPNNLFNQGFPKDLRTEQERSSELFRNLTQLAQESGFELLETEWLGVRIKHRFRHIGSGVEREWVAAQLFSQGFPKDLRPGNTTKTNASSENCLAKLATASFVHALSEFPRKV